MVHHRPQSLLRRSKTQAGTGTGPPRGTIPGAPCTGPGTIPQSTLHTHGRGRLPAIVPRRATGPEVPEACDFSIQKFHRAKPTGLPQTVGCPVTENDPRSTRGLAHATAASPAPSSSCTHHPCHQVTLFSAPAGSLALTVLGSRGGGGHAPPVTLNLLPHIPSGHSSLSWRGFLNTVFASPSDALIDV